MSICPIVYLLARLPPIFQDIDKLIERVCLMKVAFRLSSPKFPIAPEG